MEAVLHSFGYSLEFLREQIADVAEGDMAVQVGGVVNHPAWTIGHILFASQMIGGVIGAEKWLPRGWGKLFGSGSLPVSSMKVQPRMNADNADRQILSLSASSAQIRGRSSFGTEQAEKIYPTKEEFLELIRETRLRITQAVEGLDDAFLDTPFPDPSYHYVFPTIRHALTQVLVGHTSFHVGQLSVWRAAMGLPPMSRSFE